MAGSCHVQCCRLYHDADVHPHPKSMGTMVALRSCSRKFCRCKMLMC